jgi:hypothetical protein
MISNKILLLAGLISTASAGMAAAQSTSKAVAHEKSYCFQIEPLTGSRIMRTECRTKSEWARLGVDVDQELTK